MIWGSWDCFIGRPLISMGQFGPWEKCCPLNQTFGFRTMNTEITGGRQLTRQVPTTPSFTLGNGLKVRRGLFVECHPTRSLHVFFSFYHPSDVLFGVSPLDRNMCLSRYLCSILLHHLAAGLPISMHKQKTIAVIFEGQGPVPSCLSEVPFHEP
ncbi:uncharacterized protein EI90DRAFT_1066323 [Cantharellus anzutake]|uniref:uncharacterized protein n=1 Tax=Cantharellus anzutake TaxID=1750568 RepID=UPI00190437BC|nr:uncharacterized protein EI90DRAFT_1066323 [Cantharellus anzutake]KAF8331120.1 hypothetical protein EI90DRAFT_1066323 [Cantharellus anzutake]